MRGVFDMAFKIMSISFKVNNIDITLWQLFIFTGLASILVRFLFSLFKD